jgi:hypothetical protein
MSQPLPATRKKYKINLNTKKIDGKAGPSGQGVRGKEPEEPVERSRENSITRPPNNPSDNLINPTEATTAEKRKGRSSEMTDDELIASSLASRMTQEENTTQGPSKKRKFRLPRIPIAPSASNHGRTLQAPVNLPLHADLEACTPPILDRNVVQGEVTINTIDRVGENDADTQLTAVSEAPG